MSSARRKARRGAARGGLLALMMVTLVVVAPDPASAQSDVEVDGCTAVPDSGPVFDFTEACNGHDVCYIEQPNGSSADARRECDQLFRDAMYDSCATMWPERSQRFARATCYGVAWVYYLGVRAFGGFFWDDTNPLTPLVA